MYNSAAPATLYDSCGLCRRLIGAELKATSNSEALNWKWETVELLVLLWTSEYLDIWYAYHSLEVAVAETVQ